MNVLTVVVVLVIVVLIAALFIIFKSGKQSVQSQPEKVINHGNRDMARKVVETAGFNPDHVSAVIISALQPAFVEAFDSGCICDFVRMSIQDGLENLYQDFNSFRSCSEEEQRQIISVTCNENFVW